jgi:hypothetical protein
MDEYVPPKLWYTLTRQYCHVTECDCRRGLDGNWIYWTHTLVTTNNYTSLTVLPTQNITVTTAHVKCSVFNNRCLVMASNSERSSSSVFLNPSRPLTRGRVCLLYTLMALASVVFLGSESLGTRDHILLSHF